MVQPAVSVDGLVKRYGGRAVVDGLTFQVAAGSVFALLGPNGAGKTTTVETIVGLRRPDAGSVRVLGHDPARQRTAVAERLGVMLQEGGAHQAATPREMLRLYARLFRHARLVDGVIADTGLGGVADARFRGLSGGEKQRVNLALALVGAPEVLLLDEPTAGLDAQGRHDVWALIRRLRSAGVTVVLTTHLLDEAERLSDVVAVIHEGRLLALDSPAALIAAHATGDIVVTTAADVPADELAAALGAAVDAEGGGRYVIRGGGADIPTVTAWFADRGIPLTGVTTAQDGLEEVFLRLTDGGGR